MSEISEQKALEAYPKAKEEPYSTGFINKETLNSSKREGYIIGFDQGFQYFMEKAERYLQYTLYDRVEIEVYGTLIPDIICKKGFIENFKNYMKKEA